MRGGRAPLVLSLFVLVALSGSTGGSALSDAPAVGATAADCSQHAPLDGPRGEDTLVPYCSGGIRPGARMSWPSGCTMNFVVTDGTSYYIGTAGHCVDRVGQTVSLSGIGAVGKVVTLGGYRGDWAFVQIDRELEHLIDGTMCIVGGPQATPLSDGIRDPLPGETVLHYGHGAGWGQNDATKTRAGTGAVTAPFYLLIADKSEFVFFGAVGPGDSGSPILLETGEAAGIVSAHFRTPVVSYNPSVVVAARFTAAVADLEETLGVPVSIVEGAAYPAVPPAA